MINECFASLRISVNLNDLIVSASVTAIIRRTSRARCHDFTQARRDRTAPGLQIPQHYHVAVDRGCLNDKTTPRWRIADSVIPRLGRLTARCACVHVYYCTSRAQRVRGQTGGSCERERLREIDRGDVSEFTCAPLRRRYTLIRDNFMAALMFRLFISPKAATPWITSRALRRCGCIAQTSHVYLWCAGGTSWRNNFVQFPFSPLSFFFFLNIT